jgi:sec-independent protein translocase protein TatA
MELAIVLVIVLLVFGAKRIPEVASSFGKGIRDFKRSLNEVDNQIRQPDVKPAERLNAGAVDTTAPTVRDDAAAPEPKRLI